MVSSNLCVLFLTIPLAVLVPGERVIYNGTLTDAGTTVGHHNYSTIAPEVSVNVSLLFNDSLPTKASQGDSGNFEKNGTMEINATQKDTEASHNLPHSSYSNMTVLIDETLLWNDTLEANVTREDDESFQDQETYHNYRHCNKSMLGYYSDHICGEVFRVQMSAIAKERWCDWEEVINPYNALTECMENVADHLLCYYPNEHTRAFFLAMHEAYFGSCAGEVDREGQDAPRGLVVALTLLPVSLIPALVYVVVWKQKARE